LTTMGAELSAEFSTFEPDQVLIDYVKARNPAPFEPQCPDADAAYRARHRIELDKLSPMVALPDRVIRNAVPVEKAAGEPIQQAFIGSCANGTLDDLAEAARVLKGHHVAPGVRLLVTPGSQRIFAAAVKAGYVQILLDAGAVVTPATCGACYGGHMGVLGPGETCITASTRNFKGRMGDARRGSTWPRPRQWPPRRSPAISPTPRASKVELSLRAKRSNLPPILLAMTGT
jgi:3-isopropylmalate/(R)-2-methylmalate dehydratase large subunit